MPARPARMDARLVLPGDRFGNIGSGRGSYRSPESQSAVHRSATMKGRKLERRAGPGEGRRMSIAVLRNQVDHRGSARGSRMANASNQRCRAGEGHGAALTAE